LLWRRLLPAGLIPDQVIAHPTHPFLYVLAHAGNQPQRTVLLSFRLDKNGNLIAIDPVEGGIRLAAKSGAIAIAPGGKYLFFVDNDLTAHSFAIDSVGGFIKPILLSTRRYSIHGPMEVTASVSHDGRWILVGGVGSFLEQALGVLSVFRIDRNGRLETVPGGERNLLPEGKGVATIALSADDSAAYVCYWAKPELGEYRLNSSTGTLTPLRGRSVSLGDLTAGPSVIESSERFFYAVRGESGTIAAYSIDRDGSLQPHSSEDYHVGVFANTAMRVIPALVNSRLRHYVYAAVAPVAGKAHGQIMVLGIGPSGKLSETATISLSSSCDSLAVVATPSPVSTIPQRNARRIRHPRQHIIKD